MKRTSFAMACMGRMATVSLLAGGLVLAAGGPTWADRGRPDQRSDARYEQRSDQRNHGRQERSYDGRNQGRQDRQHQDRRVQAARPQQPVTVIRELPRGHRNVVVGQTRYYIHDHRFYTRGQGGYVLVRPPIGAVVASLPIGAVNISIGGVFYSRFDEVYYRPMHGGYMVVAPPYTPVVVVWTSALNVRTGPGLHFPIIAQVGQGQALTVTGDSFGWYYVRLPNGTLGWVMSDYTRSLSAG